MKRTTFSLPDDLAARMEREARRRRVSVSEVAREAIAKGLGASADEPRFPFLGIGASGYQNTARDMEELLKAEWDPDFDRDP
jgi:hypothetical protein